MKIPRAKLLKILETVQDPSGSSDLVSANMIKDISIEEDAVQFTITIPKNAGHSKAPLMEKCTEAVNYVYPDINVHIHFEEGGKGQGGPSPFQKKGPLPQVKNFIAIASGKGGVGKSTVAVNTALGLKELGAKVGLLDADFHGPSIPTMMGIQDKQPKVKDVYGKHKIIPIEEHGIHLMSIGLVVDPEQAVVLRGPRLGGLVKQFVNDCLWPELDYLIIDLPPGTGDIQLSLVQTLAITGAVIVTTPQKVSVNDAIKAKNMFKIKNINVPVLGVIENMAYFTPEELPDKKYYIFGQGGGKKLAKQSNTALLGQIPLVQGVREGGDSGSPIMLKENDPAKTAFLKAAKNLARQTAKRNESIDPTQRVEVK